jgi:hypothetical protein
MSVENAYAVLRRQIEELKLFDSRGRFQPKAPTPPDFVTACFAATSECKSLELRDRIYWVVNDLRSHPTCKSCGAQLSIPKNFSQRSRDKQYCPGGCHAKSEEVKARMRETCRRRYGIDNVGEIPEVKSKMRRTCLARYGVPHPMQDSAVFERHQRASVKLKTFTTPSGNMLRYQGYEDVALRLLFEMKLNEADIMVSRSNMPRILYFKGARRARYYPDIYVPSLNLLLEVKSVYTFNRERDLTFAKQDACVKQGYKHLIVICDKRHVLEIL